MSLEVAVFEFYAGAIRCLGNEADFDLACSIVVRLDLPVGAYVPGEHHSVWRRVGQHSGPSALDSVLANVVDVPANVGVEGGPGDRGAKACCALVA